MNPSFLDFEQPIVALDMQIEALRQATHEPGSSLNEDIEKLERKKKALIQSIFKHLDAWQATQLARHPLRPYSQDYLPLVFSDFIELSGDRHHSAAPEILTGLARLEDFPVMLIAQRKGRSIKERVAYCFGMNRPEAYRKARRIMQLAEKFSLPLITWIDTPGAYAGVEAEQHNQSEAIAGNLKVMAGLRVPILSVVLGEGGSGGALALGVSDKTLMLQYSIYSVISPESCASILWRTPDKAKEAALALQLTAQQSYEKGWIDRLIPEPEGGAHRDPETMAQTLKAFMVEEMRQLRIQPLDQLLQAREQRWLNYGR